MNTDFEARMKLANTLGKFLGAVGSLLLYGKKNLANHQYKALAEVYLDERIETINEGASQWVIQSFMPTVLEIIQEMDNREIYVKDEYRKAFINYSPVLI
jgi:hypothetical protein